MSNKLRWFFRSGFLRSDICLLGSGFFTLIIHIALILVLGRGRSKTIASIAIVAVNEIRRGKAGGRAGGVCTIVCTGM